MKDLLILIMIVLAMSGCSPHGETEESPDPIIPAIY